MKWFKHLTNAMDDLFVKDIERKFGDSGYAFWFKTLELIGNHGEKGLVTISWSNYLEKLHKRRTQVELMLDFCSTSGKLLVTKKENELIIECKKFAEYSDNYTKYGKSLQSNFKDNSKQEVDKDKKKNRIDKDIKIYAIDSDEYTLSQFLATLIRINDPKAKYPDLQKWAKEIDALIRIDLRSPVEINDVIKFCQSDSFWKTNILSTKKLRYQFPKLFLQMKEKNNVRNSGRPAAEPGKYDKVVIRSTQ
jgi:DNA-directed RNA polymerase subunit M/transcription elongation factor TFIIS